MSPIKRGAEANSRNVLGSKTTNAWRLPPQHRQPLSSVTLTTTPQRENRECDKDQLTNRKICISSQLLSLDINANFHNMYMWFKLGKKIFCQVKYFKSQKYIRSIHKMVVKNIFLIRALKKWNISMEHISSNIVYTVWKNSNLYRESQAIHDALLRNSQYFFFRNSSECSVNFIAGFCTFIFIDYSPIFKFGYYIIFYLNC